MTKMLSLSCTYIQSMAKVLIPSGVKKKSVKVLQMKYECPLQQNKYNKQVYFKTENIFALTNCHKLNITSERIQKLRKLHIQRK